MAQPLRPSSAKNAGVRRKRVVDRPVLRKDAAIRGVAQVGAGLILSGEPERTALSLSQTRGKRTAQTEKSRATWPSRAKSESVLATRSPACTDPFSSPDRSKSVR